ncbi:MAG: acetylxylan esterase [Lentisphaerae bacterium]|nr:acetylxylan esterase [Lentisphaerota bacterium]
MNMTIWRDSALELVKNHQILEAQRRHYLHQPPLTLEAWQTRRKLLIENIRTNAGLFHSQPSQLPAGSGSNTPLDLKIHGVRRLNGYEMRLVTYQSRSELRVTANLYVPDGRGPFPGIIGVHGHCAEGKINERVQARGHVLALNGFVVLMIDAFGAGERGTAPGKFEYHGAGIGATLFNIGESLLGMQVYDNMRGIDLLESLAYVDAGHIGVTGESGGGNQTMWLAALDPRIKATVPVVSVGTFESYVTRCNCVCEVLPNGLTFLEEWAVLGLVAPNPLLILNALQDNPTFSVQEMIRSFNDACQVYRLHGVEDKIAYHAFDLTHDYWPEMQRHMLGWFKRWLKGEGEGRPCDLPAYTPLPPEQCLCFPGKRRPKAVVSIPDYCRPIARRLAAGHRKPTQGVNRAAKIRRLRSLLRLPPLATGNSLVNIGDIVEMRRRIRKLIVESEPGILMPTVIVTDPTAVKFSAATIILHPQGKSGLHENALIPDGAQRKEALVLTDLRGTGETCYNPAPLSAQAFHDHSRACFWLGRTMLGDWTRDILALVQQIAALMPRVPIDIRAYHETGLAALCAAVFSGRVRSITTVGMPGSYLFSGPTIGKSMAIHVPGILRWGDISMMAALAASRVVIVNPVASDGRPYSGRQGRLLRGEIALLSKLLRNRCRVRVLCDPRRAGLLSQITQITKPGKKFDHAG